MRAVRAAIGPAIDLMVDANQSMPYPEAKRRARLYEPFDLFWLEEPWTGPHDTGSPAASMTPNCESRTQRWASRSHS